MSKSHPNQRKLPLLADVKESRSQKIFRPSIKNQLMDFCSDDFFHKPAPPEDRSIYDAIVSRYLSGKK